MTTTITERSLRLRFDDGWVAVKWDECDFRKRREQHGKAVDVVAIHGSGTGRRLFLFEIKDYPDHPLASVPAPTDLAIICAEKARDTLAQLIHSAPLVGRPSEPEVDSLCRAFGSTEHPLHVLIWVEDANEPPLEITEFQAELARVFRWLPTAAVAAAGVDELNILEGLQARRVA